MPCMKSFRLQRQNDGMEQFDVTFYVGMTEYNYDIDANTGMIVDFEAEIDD